jgi:hypothetical protein
MSVEGSPEDASSGEEVIDVAEYFENEEGKVGRGPDPVRWTFLHFTHRLR